MLIYAAMSPSTGVYLYKYRCMYICIVYYDVHTYMHTLGHTCNYMANLSHTCRRTSQPWKKKRLNLPGEREIFTNLLLALTFSKVKYRISEPLIVRALSYITDTFC